jgi:hypothetical protein
MQVQRYWLFGHRNQMAFCHRHPVLPPSFRFRVTAASQENFYIFRLTVAPVRRPVHYFLRNGSWTQN